MDHDDPYFAAFFAAHVPGWVNADDFRRHAIPSRLEGPPLATRDVAEISGYTMERVRQFAKDAALECNHIEPGGVVGWLVPGSGRLLPQLLHPVLVSGDRPLLIEGCAFAVITTSNGRRARPATRRGETGWQFRRCPRSALVNRKTSILDWGHLLPSTSN